MEIKTIMFILIIIIQLVFSKYKKVTEKNAVRFTNLWIIQVSKQADDILTKIKKSKYFEIMKQEYLPIGLYLVIHKKHPRRGKYENINVTNILLKYEGVLWTEQIFVKKSELKFYFQCPGKHPFGMSNYYKLLNDKYFNRQWILVIFKTIPNILEIAHNLKDQLHNYHSSFADQDCRRNNHDIQFDINVVRVWHQYKIFGRGVKVMVVDGGVAINHPDLQVNYDPDFGYDFVENHENPLPRRFFFFPQNHGTKCAGIIAMQANNKICGTGIAPLVTLGALRIFSRSKSYTNLTSSQGLMFKLENVDISSNSWGPDDNGKTLEATNLLEMSSFKEGIIKGRRGKGIIYIFAAGNGKINQDTCAYDHFANNLYTITVAGVKHNGSTTVYSERCSSILVAAYSGDATLGLLGNVLTTTWGGKCSAIFCGTSAATPIVAAVTALILEANPNLTWREIQHVFTWTSEIASMANNKTWSRNGAGFYVSLDFGFGLINAFNAVTFAMTMPSISPMNSCVLDIPITDKMVFRRSRALLVSIRTNGCKHFPSEVNYMEHVQLLVSVQHPRRGAIQILLISPAGTKTFIMEGRWFDKNPLGLQHWLLDSVHFWGESAEGVWSLIFFDSIDQSEHQGIVTEIKLIIHGSKFKPPHYSTIRTYYKFNR